ncbi:MAG: hypothetical protein EBT99_17195, partial [Betaproteobacteria bacterium]|nr:hypothetical protein [Betaproteobacteria bacterium]
MMQAATGLGQDVNILEAMEMFKGVPDQVLPKYAQDPKLAIFAAAEMARRDDMRKRYQQRAQKPNKPIVEHGVLRFNSGLQVPGVSEEFGGPAVEEEKELRVPAIINGQRVMATPAELRAAGYPESTIQQRVKEAQPKPAQTAQSAQTAQPAQPAQRQPLAIPVQQPQAAPPMGLAQIINTGKNAMQQLGVQPIQTPEPYETAGRADQLYKERQGRFPDEISPIMQKLKEFYDKQPTQAD